MLQIGLLKDEVSKREIIEIEKKVLVKVIKINYASSLDADLYDVVLAAAK